MDERCRMLYNLVSPANNLKVTSESAGMWRIRWDFKSKVAVKLNRPTEAMGFPFYLSTRRGGENRLTRLVFACN
jgi:hypothetical protein